MKIKKELILRLLKLLVIICAVFAVIASYEFNIIPSQKYNASDFDIDIVKSSFDFDNDGIDDYTEFLNGAKKDAESHPRYSGKYWPDGGYPPDNVGVCTDVIWRAFREAGYSLRDMVDKDIQLYPEDYPEADPDINIDFRRVNNLENFFDKYAVKLTTDINEIDQWMPGDIVIFNNGSHIGMVSDYRNRKGTPYILHNGGQPVRDEDYLKRGSTVLKHYRFDASKIDESVLIRW